MTDDNEQLRFRASEFQIDDTGALIVIRSEVFPNVDPDHDGDWKMKRDFVRAFAEGSWKQIIDAACDLKCTSEAG